MNKKMMLFPILVLLLLSVPVAIAGTVHVEGDGTYSQTIGFGEISDSVILTGEWIYKSEWSASVGWIENLVTLFSDSTFHERTISPESGYYSDGNPGLDLVTVVNYGYIQDIAEIQIRGYDFTFDASTNSPYESTKHLKIFDSHNYYYGGSSGNAQVPDVSENMDMARFQVVDTSEGIYVVGGSVEYMKPFSSSKTSDNNVFLDQTFNDDASFVTSNFYATSHIIATAYYGYTAGTDISNLDWYASVTMDIKGNDKHDKLYAYFDDDEASFYTRYGKNHPMILNAYGNLDFDAWGSAQDVDLWTFTGLNLYREDGKSINWTADLDMELP